jgi:hypothetical protein
MRNGSRVVKLVNVDALLDARAATGLRPKFTLVLIFCPSDLPVKKSGSANCGYTAAEAWPRGVLAGMGSFDLACKMGANAARSVYAR